MVEYVQPSLWLVIPITGSAKDNVDREQGQAIRSPHSSVGIIYIHEVVQR